MRPHLLLCCSSLLCFGSAEAGGGESGPHARIAEEARAGSQSVAAPEPTTMLLTGLGGLVVLLFAIRRKH